MEVIVFALERLSDWLEHTSRVLGTTALALMLLHEMDHVPTVLPTAPEIVDEA